MKFRHIILFSLLSFGLASCSMLGSLDDLEIDNVHTDQTVISDATSAENLLAGIYTGWKTFGVSTFFANQSLRAGSLATINYLGSDECRINVIQDTNGATEKFYTGLYLIINNANSFIAALEKADVKDLSPVRREEMFAEAYFQKALAEYYLLCTFGEFYDTDSKYGIVIWNEPVRASISRARSSVADSYAAILKDLDNAAKAPRTPLQGHAGIRAVMALRAKVLLYSGDFAGAARVAGELIDTNDMDLEENFQVPFANPYVSTEILFDLYCTYPNSTQSVSYGSYYSTPGAPLTALADELVGAPDDGALSVLPVDACFEWLYEDEANMAGFLTFMGESMWENPDRYGSLIDLMEEFLGYGMTEDEVMNSIGEMIPMYMEMLGVPVPEATPASGFDQRYVLTYDPQSLQGECNMSKYIYSDWPDTAGPANTIFLLRLADVYYVKAEAEARLGSDFPAARAALARVLERAGYDEEYVNAIPAGDLVATIMKHRMMENFTENQDDYFDQVRAFKWDGRNFCQNPLVAAGKTLVVPVPRAAMAGNNLLEQLPKQ